jgi:8-hydroxy-5-deazaflavin:NADPH oxidoreductase
VTRAHSGQPSGTPLTVAVLGAGVVGRTLARAWAVAGHGVILGSRQPDITRGLDTVARVADGAVGPVNVATHEAAARAADVVVVTVPGDQVPALVMQLGDALARKLVIDTTNDLTPGAPALSHLAVLRSAGAVCHRSFITVGWEQMADPVFGQERADPPYAGPEATRAELERLISDVGFRPLYLGDGEQAVEAIDALARLWFLLAFTRGHGRRLAWRLLTATLDHPAGGSSRTTESG